MSCDGVKFEANLRKYYDFVISYLQLSRKSIAQGGGIKWKIFSRLLFVSDHVGSKCVEFIKNTLNTALKHSTGFDLESFEKPFTFLTDWGAVMAKVFGASVSSKKIACRHRWVGCISHQLNTVMKTVIESDEIKSSTISKTLVAVKSIV